MMILALKLLIAHVLGDFVFQPLKWVKGKKEKKQKSRYLYLHVGVHALALLVLFQFQFSYWLGILIVIVSHFFIDLIKSTLDGRMKFSVLFALDQVAHVAIIAGVVYMYEPYPFELLNAYSFPSLLLIFALLNLIFVSSIIIKLIMSKLSLDEMDSSDSLTNAGNYIGVLERVLIFGFIIIGQWAAIGWLLAAKSIFRFGDLSRAKDRKLTEYFLIGTLLSFGLAIAIALAYQFAIKIQP